MDKRLRMVTRFSLALDPTVLFIRFPDLMRFMAQTLVKSREEMVRDVRGWFRSVYQRFVSMLADPVKGGVVSVKLRVDNSVLDILVVAGSDVRDVP